MQEDSEWIYSGRTPYCYSGNSWKWDYRRHFLRLRALGKIARREKDDRLFDVGEGEEGWMKGIGQHRSDSLPSSEQHLIGGE